MDSYENSLEWQLQKFDESTAYLMNNTTLEFVGDFKGVKSVREGKIKSFYRGYPFLKDVSEGNKSLFDSFAAIKEKYGSLWKRITTPGYDREFDIDMHNLGEYLEKILINPQESSINELKSEEVRKYNHVCNLKSLIGVVVGGGFGAVVDYLIDSPGFITGILSLGPVSIIKGWQNVPIKLNLSAVESILKRADNFLIVNKLEKTE